MNTTIARTVPVLPKALYKDTTHYLPNKLRVIWPARQPKAVVTRTNVFLRSLPARYMEKLDPFLRTVSLQREEHLWGQDEKPDFVYFPDTAVISHLKMLEDGRMVEIALTGREGSAGMQSIFGSGLSSSSAEVAHSGVAARIERAVFPVHRNRTL